MIVPRERQACFRDAELVLTPREFDVLENLASRPGWVFSAEQLVDDFDVTAYSSPFAVNVHVSHLRAKLTQAGAPDGFIETVRAAGWRIKRPLVVAAAAQAPFVGREAESRQLKAALEQGSGRFAFVVGDPGIGKTTLVEHVLGSVAPRFEVFRAVCDGNGSGDHWLWRQIIFEVQRRTGVSPYGGGQGALLKCLLGSSAEVSDVSAEGADRTLAYRAVQCYLTDALSPQSRPSLIFVDDLQWADDASLKLFVYMLKRLEEIPIALVAASRQVEARTHTRLRDVAEFAGQRAGGLLVELGGLQASEIERLVEDRLGSDSPPSLAEELRNRTAGNPLYVREYLRALSETGGDAHGLERSIAPSISQLVTSQVASLPAASRQLLLTAAVAAAEFDPFLVAEAARLPVSGFDSAIEAGIIIEHGRAQLRFGHDLVREALLESLSASRKNELHLAVAEAIRRSTIDPEHRIFLLAHHYSHAGVGARTDAAGFLISAARHSSSRFAFEDAVQHLRVALELLATTRLDPARASRVRAAILERLGGAHAALAETESATEAYRMALGARPRGDILARARILTKLGRTFTYSRQRGESFSAFSEALRCLETTSERDSAWWRAWIEVRLNEAEAAFVMDMPLPFHDLPSELGEVVERFGAAEQRAKYHCAVASRLCSTNRWRASEESVAEQRLAVACAMDGCSQYLIGNMIGYLGRMLIDVGQLEEAESVLRQSLDLAGNCADSLGEAAALFHLTTASRLAGDAKHTERRALKLRQLASERAGLPEFTSGAEAHLSWAALRKGDFRKAARLSERALAIWERDPATSEAVWMMAWPAVSCALERGDLKRAIECCALMTRRDQQALHGDLDVRLANCVSAYLAGDSAAAESHLRELEAEARTNCYS